VLGAPPRPQLDAAAAMCQADGGARAAGSFASGLDVTPSLHARKLVVPAIVDAMGVWRSSGHVCEGAPPKVECQDLTPISLLLLEYNGRVARRTRPIPAVFPASVLAKVGSDAPPCRVRTQLGFRHNGHGPSKELRNTEERVRSPRYV
jgi:hypothetical protein